MSELAFREAWLSDVAAMAEIRAGDWGSQNYWCTRIAQYLSFETHPTHALRDRVAYVCLDRELTAGLIAGHLTRRFGCDGELEWISVRPAYRGKGIAAGLLRCLAEWFVERNALRICVDVEPTNESARRFYRRHGAEDLKPHWMAWEDISVAR